MEPAIVITTDGKPNPYWTVAAAGLVLWNAANWKRPQYHLSRLARQHPMIAGVVWGAYAYHFWIQGREVNYELSRISRQLRVLRRDGNGRAVGLEHR